MNNDTSSEFSIDNCDFCKTLHPCAGVMHHHMGAPVLFECVNCAPPSWKAFITRELQRMYAEEPLAR